MNSTFFATMLRHLSVAFTRLTTATLGLALTLALISTPSLAAPGDLDTANFGPYNLLPYGTYPVTISYFFRTVDAITLPDDRIVAAGVCTSVTNAADTRFCLAVWSSAGIGGTIYVHTTPVNRVKSDNYGAVARQPDGKIVMTAPCIYSPSGPVYQICTVRFNADFSADTTFAVGYQTVAPSPSGNFDHFANAVAIQPDGKIVVAGQCGINSGGNTSMCAVRLLADGNPDTTFGGLSSLRFLSGTIALPYDRVVRIALSATGQIYLGGDCRQPTLLRQACVARLNPDGSIDQALSGGTTKPLALPTMGDGMLQDVVNDMVVQANGEFVFAGYCRGPSGGAPVPCAMRIGGFSASGFTAGTGYPGAGEPAAVPYILRDTPTVGNFGSSILRAYLQPDGKLLTLQKVTGSDNNYRVRRYNEDGSRDALWAEPVFDFHAAADNASGQIAYGRALAQQSSGRVIAMGSSNSVVNNPQARILRLLNNVNPGRNCSGDIDGDGQVLPTTDGLLLTRVAAGLTGNAVITGAVGAGAPRNTWPEIRDYLITQCGMVVAP
jgi:uncharacterized delta-60 repeat protein